MASVRYPALYQINTRVWLTALSRRLGRPATLDDIPDAELDALIAGVTPRERVHVILSPSVFVAPLRAIALAVASSDHVTVKPSKREPHFAHALIEAWGDSRVGLAPDANPALAAFLDSSCLRTIMAEVQPPDCDSKVVHLLRSLVTHLEISNAALT